MTTQDRAEAIRRCSATNARMRESYTYTPAMFDFGIALLEEGARFTVRRSGNDLWDEIVIELAPMANSAIQLPFGD